MPTRFPALVLPLAVFALTAATCNKSGTETPKPSPDSGPAQTTAPVDPAAQDRATQILSGIPGMDFSVLSPPEQKELASVMTDEFCYCGCPHTLAACLKTHSACKHAKRMATLAAGEAATGAPSTEIIVSLSKYYMSFHDPRASFKVDDRMCRGAKDAKITLIEFSDFECPYCGAARPMLEDFASKNEQRVRFCYMPFPLQSHPNAIPAGQAALYARDHGKFWEMHDQLFENQTSLNVEVIKQLATKIGLNGAELGKVIDSGKYTDELNASKEAGKSAGVNATPTLFVNGRKLDLPPNTELLERTVDDELEWQSNNGAWAAD